MIEARWRQMIEDPAGHFFALTREPIDGRALVKKMLRGEDGRQGKELDKLIGWLARGLAR